MNNLISIIIPYYKSELTIDRAVYSILKQTYNNYEIIIVDDYSDSNESYKKLLQLKESIDNRILHIEYLKKNGGPSKARNIGWNIAKGKYIAFLDADDSWHPKKLELQIEMMEKHPNFLFSGHGSTVLQEELESNINTKFEMKYKTFNFNDFLISNRVSTPTVMLKREIEFRFDENIKYSEDYRLWLEILSVGNEILYLDEMLGYLYKSRYGESGLSSNMLAMEKGELSTFKYLYQTKKINKIIYIISSGYSILKYIRRFAVVKIKKYRRKQKN